jgi:hypothetical protein
MNGRIVKFWDTLGQGVIRTDDGRKYRFSKSAVCNLNGKLVGIDVDFLVESRQPRDIFLMSGSPWTAFGGAR